MRRPSVALYSRWNLSMATSRWIYPRGCEDTHRMRQKEPACETLRIRDNFDYGRTVTYHSNPLASTYF